MCLCSSATVALNEPVEVGDSWTILLMAVVHDADLRFDCALTNQFILDVIDERLRGQSKRLAIRQSTRRPHRGIAELPRGPSCRCRTATSMS
jgi:hypothetical protein